MAIYVCSDLHGEYDLFQCLLKRISFSEQDEMIVLGDVLDRGPKPIALLLDIMQRPNITLIAGNHEVMALECMKILKQDISIESIASIRPGFIKKISNWFLNGGHTTSDEFFKYELETQTSIYDYLCNLDLYDEIEIGEKSYILVHGGLGDFSPDKPLWEYELDELVWERTDYETVYYPDKYVITGHTPTIYIDGNHNPGYIYQKNNHIAIDCGCSLQNGRLGCLRLNDLQEFYIER